MIKKILVTFLLTSLVGTVSADYLELDCSSQDIFESNSCTQCFDWWTKATWDYIGLLKDDWINSSSSDKILYKEEQEMPNMLNLNPDWVVWSQTPSSDGFWQYTEDLDALYDWDAYLLESWEKVTWIESKIGYAYKLEQNTLPENSNIGLLMYTLVSHDLLENGTPSINSDEHTECVLFKSAWESEPTVIEEEPPKLPETGPAEYILLLALAMLIGLAIIKIKNKA